MRKKMERKLEKSGGTGEGWGAVGLCCRSDPYGTDRRKQGGYIDLGAVLRKFLQG